MNSFVATDSFTVHPFQEFWEISSQMHLALLDAAGEFGAILRRFDIDQEQKTLTLEFVIDCASWVQAENVKENIYRQVFGIDGSGEGTRASEPHTSQFTVNSEQLMLA